MHWVAIGIRIEIVKVIKVPSTERAVSRSRPYNEKKIRKNNISRVDQVIENQKAGQILEANHL